MMNEARRKDTPGAAMASQAPAVGAARPVRAQVDPLPARHPEPASFSTSELGSCRWTVHRCPWMSAGARVGSHSVRHSHLLISGDVPGHLGSSSGPHPVVGISRSSNATALPTPSSARIVAPSSAARADIALSLTAFRRAAAKPWGVR